MSKRTELEISRRQFLAAAAAMGIGLAGCQHVNGAASVAKVTPSDGKPSVKPFTGQRYKVGICDWMVLKRQTPGALGIAHEIGADGVEVDMGVLSQNPTFLSKLTDPAYRQKYFDQLKQFNLEISSIAMSGFYGQDFSARDVAPMMKDTIATCKLMNTKICFLPIAGRADLVDHADRRGDVVKNLKLVAPLFEEAGITLGIATRASAAEEVKLMDEVGSKAVQSYFNFSNALDPKHEKRDIIAELKTLGRDRICMIHCTNEDAFWIQNDPAINLPAIKQVLDDMGWSGWLNVERSRDRRDSRNVRYNFGGNVKYVKSVFQGGPAPEAQPAPPPKG